MARQSPSASKRWLAGALKRLACAAMLTAAVVGPALALVDATIGTCTIVVESPIRWSITSDIAAKVRSPEALRKATSTDESFEEDTPSSW